MKRSAVLLLCLLLCYSCADAAEDAQALRVIDRWWACEYHTLLHPGQPLLILNPPGEGDSVFDTQKALHGMEWDVAVVDTGDTDLKSLFDAGLLADLGGDPAIMAQVSGMYAPVRNTLTMGRKTIGVPFLLFGLTQHIGYTTDADTLARLGFTPEDKPATFAQILALCKRYMALDAEIRRGTLFFGGICPDSAPLYFLQLFTSMYAAENRSHDGGVGFDTIAFREGVALCGRISELIQKEVVLYNDATPMRSLLSQASSHWFENIEDGLCPLTAGAQTQYPTRIFTFIVNAQSPRKAEAIGFVRACMNMMPVSTGNQFMEQTDYETLARLAYDELIAEQRAQNEAQSVIDALIAERDSGHYRRFAPQWTFQTYREEFVPYMTFPYAPFFDFFTPTKEYAAGSLDADGLILRLNQEVKNIL